MDSSLGVRPLRVVSVGDLSDLSLGGGSGTGFDSTVQLRDVDQACLKQAPARGFYYPMLDRAIGNRRFCVVDDIPLVTRDIDGVPHMVCPSAHTVLVQEVQRRKTFVATTTQNLKNYRYVFNIIPKQCVKNSYFFGRFAVSGGGNLRFCHGRLRVDKHSGKSIAVLKNSKKRVVMITCDIEYFVSCMEDPLQIEKCWVCEHTSGHRGRERCSKGSVCAVVFSLGGMCFDTVSAETLLYAVSECKRTASDRNCDDGMPLARVVVETNNFILNQHVGVIASLSSVCESGCVVTPCLAIRVLTELAAGVAGDDTVAGPERRHRLRAMCEWVSAYIRCRDPTLGGKVKDKRGLFSLAGFSGLFDNVVRVSMKCFVIQSKLKAMDETVNISDEDGGAPTVSAMCSLAVKNGVDIASLSHPLQLGDLRQCCSTFSVFLDEDAKDESAFLLALQVPKCVTSHKRHWVRPNSSSRMSCLTGFGGGTSLSGAVESFVRTRRCVCGFVLLGAVYWIYTGKEVAEDTFDTCAQMLDCTWKHRDSLRVLYEANGRVPFDVLSEQERNSSGGVDGVPALTSVGSRPVGSTESGDAAQEDALPYTDDAVRAAEEGFSVSSDGRQTVVAQHVGALELSMDLDDAWGGDYDMGGGDQDQAPMSSLPPLGVTDAQSAPQEEVSQGSAGALGVSSSIGSGGSAQGMLAAAPQTSAHSVLSVGNGTESRFPSFGANFGPLSVDTGGDNNHDDDDDDDDDAGGSGRGGRGDSVFAGQDLVSMLSEMPSAGTGDLPSKRARVTETGSAVGVADEFVDSCDGEYGSRGDDVSSAASAVVFAGCRSRRRMGPGPVSDYCAYLESLSTSEQLARCDASSGAVRAHVKNTVRCFWRRVCLEAAMHRDASVQARLAPFRDFVKFVCCDAACADMSGRVDGVSNEVLTSVLSCSTVSSAIVRLRVLLERIAVYARMGELECGSDLSDGQCASAWIRDVIHRLATLPTTPF
jgi:hypothetical protein